MTAVWVLLLLSAAVWLCVQAVRADRADAERFEQTERWYELLDEAA